MRLMLTNLAAYSSKAYTTNGYQEGCCMVFYRAVREVIEEEKGVEMCRIESYEALKTLHSVGYSLELGQ